MSCRSCLYTPSRGVLGQVRPCAEKPRPYQSVRDADPGGLEKKKKIVALACNCRVVLITNRPSRYCCTLSGKLKFLNVLWRPTRGAVYSERKSIKGIADILEPSSFFGETERQHINNGSFLRASITPADYSFPTANARTFRYGRIVFGCIFRHASSACLRSQ
jgi:hypothetical protein